MTTQVEPNRTCGTAFGRLIGKAPQAVAREDAPILMTSLMSCGEYDVVSGGGCRRAGGAAAASAAAHSAPAASVAFIAAAVSCGGRPPGRPGRQWAAPEASCRQWCEVFWGDRGGRGRPRQIPRLRGDAAAAAVPRRELNTDKSLNLLCTRVYIRLSNSDCNLPLWHLALT